MLDHHSRITQFQEKLSTLGVIIFPEKFPLHDLLAGSPALAGEAANLGVKRILRSIIFECHKLDGRKFRKTCESVKDIIICFADT